jgi:hypothetical protein
MPSSVRGFLTAHTKSWPQQASSLPAPRRRCSVSGERAPPAGKHRRAREGAVSRHRQAGKVRSTLLVVTINRRLARPPHGAVRRPFRDA